MRSSPKIARIKVSSALEKNVEGIGGKVNTPKPKMRIEYSPFVATQQRLSFSKLTPLRMNFTHRISTRSTSYSKNQTGIKGTPSCLSSIKLPAPQDLNFLILHMLDLFDSAETLTDFFFYSRASPLSLDDFIQSCKSLKLHKTFQNLSKIFEEMVSEKVLSKKSFIKKILIIQNQENSQPPPQRPTFSDILKKIMPSQHPLDSKATKKIFDIIKNAKGQDDLLAKLQIQYSKVKLTTSEIQQLLDYSMPKAKKLTKDFNITLKLNSPYSKIPSNLVHVKNT